MVVKLTAAINMNRSIDARHDRVVSSSDILNNRSNLEKKLSFLLQYFSHHYLIVSDICLFLIYSNIPALGIIN